MIDRFENLPTANLLRQLCCPVPLEEAQLGQMGQRNVPVVVIDTNVLLDIFFWRDPKSAFLSELLHRQRIIAVHAPDTIFELAGVLSRDHFHLNVDEQYAIIRAWSGYSTCINITKTSTVRCKDSDDQKFLDLCTTCGADVLITKDKLLRKAAKRLKTCRVIEPENIQDIVLC